jgi:ParB-like chromosome segregation protein Spo0J
MIPDEIQRDKPTVPISSITIRDDLYPRLQKNPALVQRYAENIEVLPPIEINQHNELIDGWHRLMAYKTANLTEIPVTVTETKSDVETLALAIERNAKHGLQLNSADKREMAIRLYNNGEGWSKKEIARILSVGESTVYRYLEGISTRCDEEIDKIILEMHRAGATQQEIADATGIPQRTISDRLQRLVVSLTRENPLNPESSPEPQPEPETTQEEEPAFEEDPDAYIPPEEVPPPEEPAEKPVPTSTFNQTNDNIEWARWSWNPVTGCRYNCPYCYARDIANRFYQEKFEPTFDRNDSQLRRIRRCRRALKRTPDSAMSLSARWPTSSATGYRMSGSRPCSMQSAPPRSGTSSSSRRTPSACRRGNGPITPG